MSDIKTIAVFGATGMLAVPVVKQLLQAGFQVKALVRNIEKARLIYPENVTLVQGDLSKIIDIEKVVDGSEAIYCNFSVQPGSAPEDFQPEREGIQNILSVAQIFNIKRLGYIASLVQNYQGMNDFDWWVFELKNKAIEMIKGTGCTYSIFYPSTFMENFSVGNYRSDGKIIVVGRARHPMYFIAGDDYGKQVANAFKSDHYENKEYVIQGPEPLKMIEAARIFVDNYQAKKLALRKLPLPLLKFFGAFNPRIKYGARVVEALNHYPEKFEAENTWKELGKPEITLKEFTLKYSKLG